MVEKKDNQISQGVSFDRISAQGDICIGNVEQGISKSRDPL
jgi:hypothetical protein